MIHDIQRLLAHISEFHAGWQLLLIAIAAGFGEEVAAFGVFALARHGDVSWWIAITGIFGGTWIAQSGLWLAGRVTGRRALHWNVFQKLKANGKLDTIHHHVVREGWIAIAVARFLPGLRVPLYLAAGMFGMGPLEFLGVLTLVNAAWLLACLGVLQSFADAMRGSPAFLVLAAVLLALAAFGVRSWLRRRRLAHPASATPTSAP